MDNVSAQIVREILETGVHDKYDAMMLMATPSALHALAVECRLLQAELSQARVVQAKLALDLLKMVGPGWWQELAPKREVYETLFKEEEPDELDIPL